MVLQLPACPPLGCGSRPGPVTADARAIARSITLGMALLATACGGGAARSAVRPSSPGDLGAVRATGEGRPPLAVVAREGDARGAVAVAVTTEGIAPERGALPAVALAALVEARLNARGITDANAVGGLGRLATARARGVARRARRASWKRSARRCSRPVAEDEPALEAVARKVERARAAAAARPRARRRGRVHGRGVRHGRRRAARRRGARGVAAGGARLGRGRVRRGGGRGAGGSPVQGRLARGAGVARGGRSATPGVRPPRTTRAVVYDASGEIPPGAARVVVDGADGARPSRPWPRRPRLGDPHGPLASRLAALDAPARVRSVVATAHGDGGCLAATLDLAARDLGCDAAGAHRHGRRARPAGARGGAGGHDAAGPTWAGAGDARPPIRARPPSARPGGSLAGTARRNGRRRSRLALVVGVAAPRERGRAAVPAPTSARRSTARRSRGTRPSSRRGRASSAARARRGCCSRRRAARCAEAAGDAGAGAARRDGRGRRWRRATAGDARVEPFVPTDGVGVLAHGPAHAGRVAARPTRDAWPTSRRAPSRPTRSTRTRMHARADVAARARRRRPTRACSARWAGRSPRAPVVGRARRDRLRPGLGVRRRRSRCGRRRCGRARCASPSLANVDAAQADAAVRAVDRWIARRPRRGPRLPGAACAAAAAPGHVLGRRCRAGAPSEALLALPLAPATTPHARPRSGPPPRSTAPTGCSRARSAPRRRDDPASPRAAPGAPASSGAPRSPCPRRPRLTRGRRDRSTPPSRRRARCSTACARARCARRTAPAPPPPWRAQPSRGSLDPRSARSSPLAGRRPRTRSVPRCAARLRRHDPARRRARHRRGPPAPRPTPQPSQATSPRLGVESRCIALTSHRPPRRRASSAPPSRRGFRVGGDRVRLLRDGAQAFPAMLDAIARGPTRGPARDVLGRRTTPWASASATRSPSGRAPACACASSTTPSAAWASRRRGGARSSRPAGAPSSTTRSRRSIRASASSASSCATTASCSSSTARTGFTGGINLAAAVARRRPTGAPAGATTSSRCAARRRRSCARSSSARGASSRARAAPARRAPALAQAQAPRLGAREPVALAPEHPPRVPACASRARTSASTSPTRTSCPTAACAPRSSAPCAAACACACSCPTKSDVPVVQFAVEALFDTLLRHGVEIWALPGTMLHAKTAIIDERVHDHRQLQPRRALVAQEPRGEPRGGGRATSRGTCARGSSATSRSADAHRPRRPGASGRSRAAGFEWAAFALRRLW